MVGRLNDRWTALVKTTAQKIAWCMPWRARRMATAGRALPQALVRPAAGCLDTRGCGRVSSLLVARSAHLTATYTEKKRIVSVSSVAIMIAVQPQQYLYHPSQEIHHDQRKFYDLLIGDWSKNAQIFR
jgi:hypothetical protein